MDEVSSLQAWDAERQHIAQKYEAQRALCEKELSEAKRLAYKWRDATEKDWRSRFTREDYAARLAPSLEEILRNRLDKAAQAYLEKKIKIEQECRKETDKHNSSWDPSAIASPKDSSIVSRASPGPTESPGPRRMPATFAKSKRKASNDNIETKPKRPRVETSISGHAALRTPSATPQSLTKPLTDRTITFDAVFNNPRHKDFIMEYPAGCGNFYVLYCEEHQVHFTRRPAQGAAKHVNGSMHGNLPKHHDVAVRELGYRVINCNYELARRHNTEVDRAYENGYKPENPYQHEKNRAAYNEVRKQKEFTKSSIHASTGSTGNTGIDSGRNLFKGIISPKTYGVYCAYWTDTRAMYPVLILGWDKQEEAGLEGTLADTQLLRRSSCPPKCYIYDQGRIVSWAPGFEDGGMKVESRQFPVMWFDDVNSWGWVDAASLREFSDYTPRPRLKRYFERAYGWITTRAENTSPLRKREDMHGAVKQATSQETLPGSERAKFRIKQDFGGDSSEAHALGAFDGELDDPELRRLAEKGGDKSSDEDYEGSASHKKRMTYRQSFYSTRETNRSDYPPQRNSEPPEGSVNSKPPTPILAPARSGPPTIGNHVLDHKMAQARRLSEESSSTRSTSPSKIGPQGNEPIAANHDTRREIQVSAQFTDFGGITTKPMVTTSAENDSVDRKSDHNGSKAPNPEQPKIPEAQTLSRGSQDDATSNISSGPARFGISQYSHGTVDWKRANLGGRCIPLYYGTDMKSVLSKGGAIAIKINATELRTFVREVDEEQNGNGILTLIFKDTTKSPVRLVFDRDSGASNLDLGKKQARVFTNWLRDCGIRPGRQ